MAQVCYTGHNRKKERSKPVQEQSKTLTAAVSLDQYLLDLQSESLAPTVFWARVVSSETESLLTRYTKHTFFEIQYALEGRLVITVGDQDRYTLDESDFIIIPPDTYHQIVDGDDTGARFIMAFSLSERVSAAFGDLLRTGNTPHKESPVLRRLLTLILQKAEGGTAHASGVLGGLIESFLFELCDILAPDHSAMARSEQALTESAARIASIRRFVAQHHGVGISVGALAKRFGISERHLNRLFQTEQKGSVRAIINHEKLHYIEELVASTSLSLGEISALCGFSDEYAMNKFFKRYNHVGLSEYRRTAKHNKAK